jgi:double-stranded RNA-specific adenosine deaminase
MQKAMTSCKLTSPLIEDGKVGCISAIRHAEKDRKSTCFFADTVAHHSIDAYKAHCPAELQKAYKQTVMAAFLICRDHEPAVLSCLESADPSLCEASRVEVVALGVGTKTCHLSAVDEDQCQIEASSGCVVRDCHAEVLARRGLKCYLMEQLRLLYTTSNTDNAHESRGNINHCCIFEFSGSDTVNTEDQRLGEKHSRVQLKPGVTVHMYSSSQPCGNASVKRWGKGGVGAVLADQHSCPDRLVHAKRSFSAIDQGEISILLKKDGTCKDDGVIAVVVPKECGSETTNPTATIMSNNPCIAIPSTTNRIHQNQPPLKKVAKELTPCPLHPAPPGTAYPSLIRPTTLSAVEKSVGCATEIPPTSLQGVCLSCSDKMLLWNCIGLQGGILAKHLCSPLYLHSVTVGRKFSKNHLGKLSICTLNM